MRTGGVCPANETLRAGDLVLLAAPAGTRIWADGDSSLTVAALGVAFGAEAVAELLPTWFVVHDFASVEPGLAHVAADLGVGCQEASSVESVVCGRILLAIVSTAIRAWATRSEDAGDETSDGNDPYLRRAVEAVHHDLSRPWTVAELARIAAMSRSTFAQRFRDALGTSPAEYVAQARMDRAREYLRRGELTVTEVSRALGYGSDEGFSRAFVRHTGSLPSAWRRGAAATATTASAPDGR